MIELKKLKLIYNVIEDIDLNNEVNLPKDLSEFYQICNGIEGDLSGENSLIIYSKGFIKQRNEDYEIEEYLPDFIMIGDDGGGVAILIKKSDQSIYASGMGTLDEISTKKTANSLEDFLIEKKGNLENYYENR